VCGKEEIDLAVDPPPDLVLEVDISRTSRGRFPIYGALGVPEVWLYDGNSLHVYIHRQGKQYDARPTSGAFPDLPIQRLVDFLSQRHTQGDTQIMRAFRRWVRQWKKQR
jgi:Uma2 family endonuclease